MNNAPTEPSWIAEQNMLGLVKETLTPTKWRNIFVAATERELLLKSSCTSCVYGMTFFLASGHCRAKG
jgi:hypothetical protein